MVSLVVSDHRYVYLLQSGAHPPWYKIGYSKNPQQRAAELNEKDKTKLEWALLDSMWCPNEDAALVLEKTLHDVFAHRRVVISRQWFVLEEADVQLIRILLQTAKDRDLNATINKIVAQEVRERGYFGSPKPSGKPASKSARDFCEFLCDEWSVVAEVQDGLRTAAPLSYEIYEHVKFLHVSEASSESQDYEITLIFDDKVAQLAKEAARPGFGEQFAARLRFLYDVEVVIRAETEVSCN